MSIHRTFLERTLRAFVVAGVILWGGRAVGAQVIVQHESRADFESTYSRDSSPQYILLSKRGLELSRLLSGALAHADATGDTGYRLFFEKIREYGDCLRKNENSSCQATRIPAPHFRTGAEEDRYRQLVSVYTGAFYRILQVQGQARFALQTRNLKPATDAFELETEILGDFSLNREHSIDRRTVELLRNLKKDPATQPIPDASLYLIYLRALASLPAPPLRFQQGNDLPAHTGTERVERLKSYLRKSGQDQVLFHVPGSLRSLASNI